jgi:hypothetical protein
MMPRDRPGGQLGRFPGWVMAKLMHFRRERPSCCGRLAVICAASRMPVKSEEVYVGRLVKVRRDEIQFPEGQLVSKRSLKWPMLWQSSP